MPERLSAPRALTTCHRLVLLALASLATFVALSTLWNGLHSRDWSSCMAPVGALLSSGLLLAWAPCHVALVDSCLVIGATFSEIHVPVAEVERVERAWSWNPEIAVLVLKGRSRFGRRIRFIPRGAPWLSGERSRVPEQLRNLIESPSYAACPHDHA